MERDSKGRFTTKERGFEVGDKVKYNKVGTIARKNNDQPYPTTHKDFVQEGSPYEYVWCAYVPLIEKEDGEMGESILNANKNSKMTEDKVLFAINGGSITFNGRYFGFKVEGQKPAYFYPSELKEVLAKVLQPNDLVTLCNEFKVKLPSTPELPQSHMLNRIKVVSG